MENSSLIQRFVNGKGTAFAERCLLCMAITVACIFYSFEDHYPHSDLIRIALFCLMAAVWFVSAAESGKDKKPAFPVFMCIYWVLPYIFTLYYSVRDNVKHYLKPLSFINRVCKDLLFLPFEEVSKRLGIGSLPAMFGFFLCVAVFYVFGVMLRGRHDKAYIPQRMKTAGDNDTYETEREQNIDNNDDLEENTDNDNKETEDYSDLDALIFSLENKNDSDRL